jgi:hypothetical protein
LKIIKEIAMLSVDEEKIIEEVTICEYTSIPMALIKYPQVNKCRDPTGNPTKHPRETWKLRCGGCEHTGILRALAKHPQGNLEEIQQKTLQSTQEEPGGRQDRKA